MSGQARLSADARRARILDAAAAEFAAHGYAQASLRGIATGAGVTTPVVYDHFASKAALYAAVAEQSAQALNAAWSQPTGDTPEEVVRSGLASLFGWIEEHPVGWRIIFGERPPADADVTRALADGQDEASAAIARIFGDLPGLEPPAGLSPAVGLSAYAEATKTAVNGLAAWWWDHRDVPKDVVVAIAMDIVWHGLAARTTTKEQP